MPKTAEEMREMRRKYGLGEFKKKGGSEGSPPPQKMRPRAKGNVKVSRRRRRVPSRDGIPMGAQTMSQQVARTSGFGASGGSRAVPLESLTG